MSELENGNMMCKSRKILASGQEHCAVDKMRHLCLSRGATGILGLGRCFRRMDHAGEQNLNLEDFMKGLYDNGLTLTHEEAAEVFNKFDTDGSGFINISEFLIGIRVSLSS